MTQSFIKIFLCLFFFFGIPVVLHAQQNFRDPKQSNISGSDIVADAPWRIKKTDASGDMNGIPVHVFIKDANVVGYNAELISLNIFIKNASDTSFGNPVVFDTYSDSAFLSLFSAKSQFDPDLDIQSFDASLPVKDSNYTIGFTVDTCSWPDNCTYVDITRAFWYFTMNIPPEKLAGLEDIIDIRVDFSLNWQTDQITYLRVFRYENDLPQLSGWYRGDAHYHTMYTNNTAEYGLPLISSKEAAKEIGIDWIASTNHSCDYDNYGISMADNWTREKTEIQNLNIQDSSMIFIHAEEVSVNNSADDLIHLLCYPSDLQPYSLSFLGDGDGDVTATSLTIDDILYPLSEINGFAYAPHPFAGSDKLSSLIDGGIWNVGDTCFYANGTAIAGNDVVICNDPASASDMYSQSAGQLFFKKEIKGGEIWNCRNAMGATDEAENPWNVGYDPGTDPFVSYDTTNTGWHWNRYRQNMEAVKFLNRKALIEKNINPSLTSYRFYYTAGSDAHGSFNYSNTDFVMGVVADVHDNALGRPSTMVYCPNGMGPAGENVLKALRNGNAVMSDGPLMSIALDLDNDQHDDFICGDEALPDAWQYMDSKIHFQIATTPEFGNIDQCRLVFGTADGEQAFLINVPASAQLYQEYFSLDSLITQMEQYDTIQDWEYFYIRAEMQTHKKFDSLSVIYCDTAQDYHAITNPVWIKKPAVIVGNQEIEFEPEIKYYPNPFTDELTVFLNLEKSANVICELFDVTGRLVFKVLSQNFSEGEHFLKVNTGNLSQGIYTMHIEINNFQKNSKLIKLYDR